MAKQNLPGCAWHSTLTILLGSQMSQSRQHFLVYFLGENDKILMIISKNRQCNWTNMKGDHIKICAKKTLF